MGKWRTLAVKLSHADYDHYMQEAKAAGLSLADWTRRKLSVPLRPEPVVLDEAFRRLDVSDSMRELSGTVPPPPPEKPVLLPVVEIGTPMRGQTHSCRCHVATSLPGQGIKQVCTAGTQYGRPCYWPSAGAKDCTYFQPRGG